MFLLSFYSFFSLSSPIDTFNHQVPRTKGNISIDFSGLKLSNPVSLSIPSLSVKSSLQIRNLHLVKNIHPFIFSSHFDRFNLILSRSTFSNLLSPALVIQQKGIELISRTFTQADKTELNTLFVGFSGLGEIYVSDCIFNGIKSIEKDLFFNGSALSLNFGKSNAIIQIYRTQFIDCQTFTIDDFHSGGAIFTNADAGNTLNMQMEGVSFTRCIAKLGASFWISSTDENGVTLSVRNFNVSNCVPTSGNVNAMYTSNIINCKIESYIYGLYQNIASNSFFGRVIQFHNCDGNGDFLQFTTIQSSSLQPVLYIIQSPSSSRSYTMRFNSIGFFGLTNAFPIYLDATTSKFLLTCYIDNFYSSYNDGFGGVGSYTLIGKFIPQDTQGMNIPTPTDTFSPSAAFTQSSVFTPSRVFSPSRAFTASETFNVPTMSPSLSNAHDEMTTYILSEIEPETTPPQTVEPRNLDVGLIVGSTVGGAAFITIIIILIVLCCLGRITCCFKKAFHPEDEDDESKRELYFFPGQSQI
ncbi:hypothetical protein TRFO_41886 [Tritrichomonas foetus]|uniref:Uncharacterized protein n=1 Tax=Tritrichomonas foetus TaxID=1144522 RepID=A0A1J4KYJ2_9EUKA|nr:hypothetical protein TRFO_41886 [Tritrichomonas foetus]|eukprot:OHT16323.1 hypothetical protein TRFO_41886 [Tritrichomonas foetus]